jgi:predicted DNA-binding transcriptional regulator AlpA
VSDALENMAEAIVAAAEKPKTYYDGRAKYSHHTKPCAPDPNKLKIDTAHIRLAEVLSLMGWSSSTLYKRMTDGKFPAADGRDGRNPYWFTKTIRLYLDGKK